MHGMWLKDKFESLGKKASSIINEIFKLLKRPFLYYVLGIVVIAISHYVFSYFGFLHTDIDSARYMLSALVQGEAAIVALVVTLSLVAVQLAAQSYSARVIEVFRKAPDLWILMAIYGVAIFYGLGVLKLIETVNPQLCTEEYICFSNLESYISFAYYFGIFAFMALVPYIWKTLDMLKPSTVIKTLTKEITKENILSAIGEELEEFDEKDPILPIIDIVRRSIQNHDYETARDGLRAIKDRANIILKNSSLQTKDEKKNRVGEEIRMSIRIFVHLTRIGRLAARLEDEDCAWEVIDTVYNIGQVSAKQQMTNMTEQAGHSLFTLGMETAKHGLENATIHAKTALETLEDVAKKKSLVTPLFTAKRFVEKIDEVITNQNEK